MPHASPVPTDVVPDELEVHARSLRAESSPAATIAPEAPVPEIDEDLLAGTDVRTDGPAEATTAEPEAEPTPEEPPPGRHVRPRAWGRSIGRALTWVVPAVAMYVVGQLYLTRPVLGWDEMATWNASQRPIPKIMSLIANFDGVLAPYYLFMHWWTGIFGTSHLALRAPSLIAMTIAAALVARLGTRLIDPFAGLIAGLLFVAIPAVSRYAQDARPYGLAVLFATLATLLLVRAIERPTPLRWLPYALAVAFLGLSNILGLLLLAGHAVAVIWRLASAREWRLLWWPLAAALGVAPAIPLIKLALPQHDAMLAWIHVYDWRVAAAAPGDIFGATVAGLLIMGLALLARPASRWVLAGLLAIAILPPAALLLASIGSHVWVPRYVLFTVVAWVLLAAFALRGTRVRAVLVVALVAAVAMPAQFDIRGDDTHIGPDNRLVGEFLRAHAEPGDGIIYAVEDLWSTRNGIEYYLGADAPRDVLLHRSRVDNNTLVDTECPDAAACIGDTKRLWLYRCANSAEGLAHIGSAEHFLRLHTTLAERYNISGCTLKLYVRGKDAPAWPQEPVALHDPDAGPVPATDGD